MKGKINLIDIYIFNVELNSFVRFDVVKNNQRSSIDLQKLRGEKFEFVSAILFVN